MLNLARGRRDRGAPLDTRQAASAPGAPHDPFRARARADSLDESSRHRLGLDGPHGGMHEQSRVRSAPRILFFDELVVRRRAAEASRKDHFEYPDEIRVQEA